MDNLGAARKLVDICSVRTAKSSISFGLMFVEIIRNEPAYNGDMTACSKLAEEGNRWKCYLDYTISSYSAYHTLLQKEDRQTDPPVEDRLKNCEVILYYLGKARTRIEKIIDVSVCYSLPGLRNHIDLNKLMGEIHETRSLYDIIRRIEIWDRGDSNSGRAAPNRQ